MDYKQLQGVLRAYYGEDSVKHLLAPKNNKPRPSYEKMYILWEKHGIPFQAWKDIKAWLKEQETKEKAEK